MKVMNKSPLLSAHISIILMAQLLL